MRRELQEGQRERARSPRVEGSAAPGWGAAWVVDSPAMAMRCLKTSHNLHPTLMSILSYSTLAIFLGTGDQDK